MKAAPLSKKQEKSLCLLIVLFAILVTFAGFAFGWLDLIWCLLFKHLIFAKA